MQRKFLFAGAAVILIAALVFVFVSGGSKDSDSSMSSSSGSSSSMDMKDMDMSSSGDTSKATATNAVKIENYMFGPMAVTVKVGDTVTWTNQDVVKHNVVSDSGSDGPNGPLIGRGETYSYTFKKAGTYKYHCDPHPYMKATVVVTE